MVTGISIVNIQKTSDNKALMMKRQVKLLKNYNREFSGACDLAIQQCNQIRAKNSIVYRSTFKTDVFNLNSIPSLAVS